MPRSRKRRINKARKNPQTAYGREQPRTGKSSSNFTTIVAGALILALVAGGLFYFFGSRRNAATGQEVTTASGLKYVDIVEGTGPSPKPGQMVSVQYTGTLQNGTKFDSSYDHGGKPLVFPIGQGRVIKGWEEGLMTMKVGGKRRLIVPPDLGYRAEGRPPDIPGNSTLIFDVELVDVK